MKRDGNRPPEGADPEHRRPAARRGSGPGRQAGRAERRQNGFVERATASGHSGYGSESVRPHLRDQLKLKALLPSPFPVPDTEGRSKDGHHQ